MKKSLIYTKGGDSGTTSLVGGSRVSKSNPRLEAYGDTDELSSTLGLLRTYLDEACVESTRLLSIQHNLFRIGSYLATDQEYTALRPQSILSDTSVTELEKWIDETDAALPELHAFILPGGSREAATCHICRTVCRRTERRILSLQPDIQVDTTLLAYMNRLSDYLFVLARKLNHSKKIAEIYWNNACK